MMCDGSLGYTMIFWNHENDFVNTLEHMGGKTFEHLQCRQTLVFRKLGFLKWFTLLNQIDQCKPRILIGLQPNRWFSRFESADELFNLSLQTFTNILVYAAR